MPRRLPGSWLRAAACRIPRQSPRTIGLQVCKQYLPWCLRYTDRTSTGLFGAPGNLWGSRKRSSLAAKDWKRSRLSVALKILLAIVTKTSCFCIHVYAFMCLHLYVSVYVYTYPYFYLSICPSIYLSFYLSICLSVYLFIHLCIHIYLQKCICIRMYVFTADSALSSLQKSSGICAERLSTETRHRLGKALEALIASVVSSIRLCICTYIDM